MRASRKTRKAARQLFRLCRVDGRIEPARVRLVGQRLAGSTRRGSLAVLSDFRRLVRLNRDRHAALVESAGSLTSELRDSIRADLSRLYGPGLETAFGENPGLIGGMRIKVGSDVYDGSVRARLAAIEARL
jgi:F-type H+-transporting ATPase subunit delta